MRHHHGRPALLMALLLLLLGGFVTRPAAGSAATALNLAPNPGFEQLCKSANSQPGARSGSIVGPCSWSAAPDAGALSTSTVAHTGLASARATSSSDDQLEIQSGCIDNVGAGVASLSVWYRLAGGADVLYLGVGTYSMPGCSGQPSPWQNVHMATTDNDTWQQANATSLLPFGTRSARIQIASDLSHTSQMFLDDVAFSVAPLSGPTAGNPGTNDPSKGGPASIKQPATTSNATTTDPTSGGSSQTGGTSSGGTSTGGSTTTGNPQAACSSPNNYPPTSGSNLVPNPGFEQLYQSTSDQSGSVGTNLPCSWSAEGTAQLASVNATVHGGNASAEVSPSTTDQQEAVIESDCFATPASGTYTLSFWYNAQGASLRAVQLQETPYGDAACGTALPEQPQVSATPSTPDSQWRQVSGTVTLSDTSQSARLTFRVFGGAVLVDDVALQQSSNNPTNHPPVTSSTTNLAPNPSFETACQGGSTAQATPCHWTVESADSTAFATLSPVAHTGSKSLSALITPLPVLGLPHTANIDVQSDCISGVQSGTAPLSFWYRVAGTATVRFSVESFSTSDCSGSTLQQSAPVGASGTSAAQWRQASGNVTVPAHTASARLVLEVSASTFSIADIDDVNFGPTGSGSGTPIVVVP